MRKNTTIYNHKKFADAPGPAAQSQAQPATKKPSAKPNFKDAAYINRILKNTDTKQAANQLIFLAVRSIFGDQKIKELTDQKKYDQTVFSLDNNKKIIEFLISIKSDNRIDKTQLSKVEAEILPILTKKLTDNSNLSGGASGTGQTQQSVNQQVPQAPSMLSPAQAAEQAQITPEQADKYLSNIIPKLVEMSANKEKTGEFTQRYSNEYNYIINSMSVLRNDPKFFEKLEGYNTKFKTLAPIYNNAMHPTGWTAAGNSVFVTDWYTLGDQIINDIQGVKLDEAKKKLTTFQTEFLNKNPKNTDISGVANKVNQFLDQYNTSGFGKTNILPRLK